MNDGRKRSKTKKPEVMKILKMEPNCAEGIHVRFRKYCYQKGKAVGTVLRCEDCGELAFVPLEILFSTKDAKTLLEVKIAMAEGDKK